MRKVVGVFFAAMFVLICLAGQAAAEVKLVYVDLSRLFAEYNKTKDYDKVLTEKESAYGAEREKKVSDIKGFQDKVNLLSDKEKEAKRPDLESKVKTLQEYDRQKQADLRKEQDEKMKEILKDIEETVKKYSEKEGYTFVFNDRVLVYQDKKFDITDKIVGLLNNGYKK